MPAKNAENLHRKLRFTRASVTAIQPVGGSRTVFTCSDKLYLKLRVTKYKTFYYQRKIRGRQETVTIGRFPEITVAQAREAADQINAKVMLGDSVQASRRAEREEYTLGDVWEHYSQHRARKREGANSSTLDHQWERYLSRWKGRRLSDLPQEEAQKYVFRLREGKVRMKDARGKERLYGGPGQANRVQRMAKAMYNHAIAEMGWEGANPFNFAQKSESGRERDRRLTRAEVRRLMKALDELQNQTSADFFRMCMFSGQRAGNVKSMRYADVDLETGSWRVGVTKTGKVHRVTLSSRAVDLVEARQKDVDSPYVFPGRRKSSGARGHLQTYMKAWRRVCELAKLEDVTVHDLRHLSATQEHEARVLEAIRERLGHASTSMTESYIHATTDLERAMRDASLKESLGE